MRTAHGRARELGRLTASECLPLDELPGGVPADADAESRAAAEERGPFTPGNRRSVLGGRAKRGKVKLASRIGLVAPTSDFAPYHRKAIGYRRSLCAELAATVGGGTCGTAPSGILGDAATAKALVVFFVDKAASTGDPAWAKEALRAMAEHRAAMRDAHQLAAMQAQGRRRGVDPIARLAAELDATPIGGDAK